MKETTIPFGASDSELIEATYFLPQGYHAVIDGNKVIIKKGEEPISNDLEEAARKIATRHSHITGDTYYDNDAWFFKKGAQWQKEKIMEDAVDGEIYFSLDYQQYRINTEPLTHFHHGDKVKLIIIKEE